MNFARRFAGVVLAGGASRRMGSDKAVLPWRGKTFLQRARELAAAAGASAVFVQGRGDCADGLPDRQERAGPAQGVVAAVDYLKSADYPAALFLAVDMPAVEAAELIALVQAGASQPACYDGAWLPLWLPLSCVSEAACRADSMYRFVRACGARIISPAPHSVRYSINTPADYRGE